MQSRLPLRTSSSPERVIRNFTRSWWAAKRLGMEATMKMIRFAMLPLFLAGCADSQAPSAPATPDTGKLVGAWHLASIVGPDGKLVTAGVPVGMLIYTRDGHMSVQLMYPKSSSSLSNEYVRNGYEASFGSYDINEATHTVTHHVQGSNTGDL